MIKPAEKGVVSKQAIGHVLATQMNSANPPQMIEAHIVAAHFVRFGSQSQVDSVQQFAWCIADADNLCVAVVLNRLCDQPSRIGEVYDPCLGAETFDQLGLLDGDADGSKRHRHPART